MFPFLVVTFVIYFILLWVMMVATFTPPWAGFIARVVAALMTLWAFVVLVSATGGNQIAGTSLHWL